MNARNRLGGMGLQRLPLLASHPNITSLPGLIFEPKGANGELMEKIDSIALQLFLGTAPVVSEEHRMLAAYRIGYWFGNVVARR